MPDDSTGKERIEELTARLEEAEETLRAIRAGEIDALIVQGPHGEQVYTLRSAEQPYRNLVEEMQEGAAILTGDGDIIYCNRKFAQLVSLPLEEVIGGSLGRFVGDADRTAFTTLLAVGCGKRRSHLTTANGREHPAVRARSIIARQTQPLAGGLGDWPYARASSRRASSGHGIGLQRGSRPGQHLYGPPAESPRASQDECHELGGHEVLEAEEGLAGLEMLIAERPDIAVIDVGLPGLNGYEIARRFRAEPDGDGVVLAALTGYGTSDALERSRQAGFDHHLIKPINPDTLRELMSWSSTEAAEIALRREDGLVR